MPGTSLQWFYENKPLQYTKMVNGPSYKKWKLPLPVMSTLYRLAGQVRGVSAKRACASRQPGCAKLAHDSASMLCLPG